MGDLHIYNIHMVVSGIGRPPARLIVENGDGALSITRSLCRFETYRPHQILE